MDSTNDAHAVNQVKTMFGACVCFSRDGIVIVPAKVQQGLRTLVLVHFPYFYMPAAACHYIIWQISRTTSGRSTFVLG